MPGVVGSGVKVLERVERRSITQHHRPGPCRFRAAHS